MTSRSQPTASSNTSFTRLLISLSAFFNLFFQCSWRSENRRGHILKYCSIYQRATMRWSPLKLLRAFSLVSFALAGALVLRRRSHFYDDAVKNTLETDSGSAFETIDSMSNNKFPGRFNLMEDASWFNGALKRPIQACSLGKWNGDYEARITTSPSIFRAREQRTTAARPPVRHRKHPPTLSSWS